MVIREGQQPLKRVKPRAATLNRKREIEEAKRDGEIIMQGLYSEEQTELVFAFLLCLRLSYQLLQTIGFTNRPQLQMARSHETRLEILTSMSNQ